ncbi:MAG: alpha/beta hydrolase [Acidiphilium sp.]|nr:alpha/beta hydrolase [Acidiphilium sp.]MDD4936188.1 alpha/beta hydrolase [Acidiphilium sp.]
MDERYGVIEAGGVALHYAHLIGDGPTVVFLPGFASDMQGSKAVFLRDACAVRGQAMLRLDYSGHGASGGRFEEGTIGRWSADALAVIGAVVPTQTLVLVGSSMGGWIMLLLLRALGARVAGVVGVAAAPDFTEDLIRPELSAAAYAALARDGMVPMPNPYGPPTPLTAALLDDGRAQLVLRSPIRFAGPVRLVHGQRDADVPWQTSLRLAERITGDDVQIVLIKDGEHRLSRPSDLAVIGDATAAVVALCKGSS